MICKYDNQIKHFTEDLSHNKKRKSHGKLKLNGKLNEVIKIIINYLILMLNKLKN